MGGVPPAIGKYAPVGRLGTGGMADVFLVVARGPERVERLAVLKRLRHPERPDLLEMFLDEARLAVRLTHPNIVHTYEVGNADDDHFMTMEYLEGQPLSEILRVLADRGEGLSEACVASVAAQALKGLHYAHEFCDFDGTSLGIVHRDVSPHNVFVTYSGEVKILDFGIAKAHLNSARTETGVLKGKLRYMSPEQAREQDVDRRSDVFAFGIVLWEMLARRALFTGDAIAVLNQIASRDVPRLSTVRPDISPELETIVVKALRREREDRYATADAMRVDIQRALRGAGDDDSRAELARVMNELFASERDMVRSQVRIHLARPAGQHSFASQPDMAASLPTLVAATPEQGSSPPLTASRRVRGARERRRWLVAMGAAIAIAGGLIGLVLTQRPGPNAASGDDSIAPLEPTVAHQAGDDAAHALALEPRPAIVPSTPDIGASANAPHESKRAVSLPRPARSVAAAPSAAPAPVDAAPSSSARPGIRVQMLDESDSQ